GGGEAARANRLAQVAQNPARRALDREAIERVAELRAARDRAGEEDVWAEVDVGVAVEVGRRRRVDLGEAPDLIGDRLVDFPLQARVVDPAHQVRGAGQLRR